MSASTNSNIQLHNINNMAWLRCWLQQFVPTRFFSQCGFTKRCGWSAQVLLRDLIALIFTDIPLYCLCDQSHPNRSVYYEFMAKTSHNWEKFMYLVATPIVVFFGGLTKKRQRKVLIVDDSAHKRARSKKVELLGSQYDHSMHKHFWGFRMLTLCWSDGHSLVPLQFELLTNSDASKRMGPAPKTNEATQPLVKRIAAATSKATDLVTEMVKNALNAGVSADYVVLDSWFAHGKVLLALKKWIQVVCMVKKNPKQVYRLGKRILTAEQIYARVSQRKGGTQHKWGRINTQKVHMLNGPESMLLVFITDAKNSANWTVLASTDTKLSAKEVVEIYAKRWHIEEFFKNAKQHLGLVGECQARKYASLIAHVSIVFLRYMMLEFAKRQNHDEKTIPGIFREHKQELMALCLLTCIQIVLSKALEIVGNQASHNRLTQLYQVYSQITPENLFQHLNVEIPLLKSES